MIEGWVEGIFDCDGWFEYIDGTIDGMIVIKSPPPHEQQASYVDFPLFTNASKYEQNIEGFPSISLHVAPVHLPSGSIALQFGSSLQTLGCILGTCDGVNDGSKLGCRLGISEGSMLGCRLGISDGCTEGIVVGIKLGTNDGLSLGN